MAMTPPIRFPIAILLAHATLRADQWERWQNRLPSNFWMIPLARACIAGALAFWLAGRRGQTWGGRVFWTMVAALTGNAVKHFFPR
jgi:hypothetical protein